MCGIHFALSSTRTNNGLDKFMRDAFLANQVRGTDSAGIFRISHPYNLPGKPNTRTAHEYKAAVCGSDFLRHQVAKTHLDAVGYSAASVGHVRAATHGAVTKDNAHPFTVIRDDLSEIIGVHNGSLKTGWRDLKDADTNAVDSEWMYERIAEDGVNAFKGFDGAYVLVWYDSRTPEVINLARNEQRPLFMAWTKDRTGIIGASELGMLGWLADRNGVELWADHNGRKFFYLGAGNLYTINLNTMELVDKGALPKYDATANPYKQEKPPATYTPINNRSHWNPAGNHSTYDPYRHVWNMDSVFATVDRIIREEREKENLPVDPKVALRQAISDAVNEVVTSDDLRDGADAAADVEAEEASLALEGFREGARFDFAQKVHDGTATKNEIQLAKDLGYYGLVGRCYTYYYDSDEQEWYCSFKPGIVKSEANDFVEDARICLIEEKDTFDGKAWSPAAVEKMHFAIIGVRTYTPPKGQAYMTYILSHVTSTNNRYINRRITINKRTKETSVH